MDFREEALFELRFWMQIMGDHSRFYSESFAPDETNRLATSNAFTQRFDQLLLRSRQPLDDQKLVSLLQESAVASEQFHPFTLSLLKGRLTGNIKTGLPPTFFNHKVSEGLEAIRVLRALAQGKSPEAHPLHHDLLWLLDAAAHAGAVRDRSDFTEKNLKQRGHEFAMAWEEFYVEAVEYAGYLRTNISQFPALARFHREIEYKMYTFLKFLRELEEMALNKELLGGISPLMIDHMAREGCYYLTKLTQTTEVKSPPCDPTKPRTESARA
ncbi:DUF2935 domain-containing protein [Paenibacillus gansuensis]|uniref:DUF2935 domain-containing protein n=1 Tax=Paenibacillus gansuensis TaxID=306542 RepID=A0ABW5P9L2_9BACL